MALMVKNTIRSFVLKRKDEDVVLDDPNPNMTPEEVCKFYSGRYPELTSASASGPKLKEGKAVYYFEAVIGDKG